MIRPQKNFTNRLIDQWEQNLLLKVMERKIKTAKSTIPGAKKSHQQSNSQRLKPRNACSLEWNLSDLKKRLPLVRNSNPEITDPHTSMTPRQLNQKEILAKLNTTNEKKFIITPNEPVKTGGVKIRELHDGDEENERPTSVPGTDVESVGPDISDGFLTDEFEDTDDDLLSQLWNSCKREDALLDGAPLPKQRRVGPTTTAVIFVNTTTVADRSKTIPPKENRPRKTLQLAKKSNARNIQMLSKFMKKREDGWRE